MARHFLRSLTQKNQQPSPNPSSNSLSEPRSPANDSVSVQDAAGVKSRLHALFHSNRDVAGNAGMGEAQGPSNVEVTVAELGPEKNANGGWDLARSATFPLASGSGSDSSKVTPDSVTPLPKPQRQAIKVLLVTWNMGDALPKGDLSVLLGKVPPYIPQLPIDGQLPDLPVENGHPYHIIFVAGQECPTPSGAPRGLGGGLIKGVTLRHKRESKDKDRLIVKDSKDDVCPEKEKEDPGPRSPAIGDDEEERYNPLSPINPHSPYNHRLPSSTKGWSQMLDDYLCGPDPHRDVSHSLPSSIPSNPNSTPRQSPLPKSSSQFRFPSQPPVMRRSASVPVPPSTPLAIPLSNNSPHGHSHLRPTLSPVGRSRSSFESSEATDSDDNGDASNAMTSDENIGYRPEAMSSPAKPRISRQRPEISIPNEDKEKEEEPGSYVHVAKERLLGMYCSLYVYKGAEHLIGGLDKDFVTAGLAGGRVGNKGGIGMSLKIAGHTMLFVNSHLAAHTHRINARLENIEKIKQELKLDCFLPKDDPRAKLEDITERFDTTFWCGDLNFRLNLTRNHADWLIKRGEYAKALAFDQLREVMANPAKNPFPGFEEGPIDFPCTFKYDVWKSVRTTNRTLRRTLKRRKSSVSAVSAVPGTLTAGGEGQGLVTVGSHVRKGGHQKSLSGVPEGDAIEEMGLGHEDKPKEDESEERSAERSEDEEEHQPRQSYDSSRYTSGINSTAATDIDDDSDADAEDNEEQASHQQIKAFEVALKEKARHVLEFVKMESILTPSPSKKSRRRTRGLSLMNSKSSQRRSSEKQRGGELDVNDRRNDPRRTSLISFVSTNRHTDATDNECRRTSFSSYRETSSTTAYDDSLSPSQAGQSYTSHGSLSPPIIPFARRRSILQRTVSGKSQKDGFEEEDDFEMGMDRREGIYDSSKKQRVPSWCDRVLWKAHIIPDPPSPTDEDPPDEELIPERGFHRFTTAVSNFGGHFRIRMDRFPSREPTLNTILAKRAEHAVKECATEAELRDNIQQILSSAEHDTNGVVVDSPPESPDLRSSPAIEQGLIPAPKRASPRCGTPRNKFFPASRSIPAPATPSGSSTPAMSNSSPEPVRSKIAFTSTPPRESTTPSPTTGESPQLSRLKAGSSSRPRANSDNVTAATAASEAVKSNGVKKKKARASDGIVGVLATPTKAYSLGRRLSGASARSGSRSRAGSPRGVPRKGVTIGDASSPAKNLATRDPQSTTSMRQHPAHAQSYAPSHTSQKMTAFPPLSHAATVSAPTTTTTTKRETEIHGFNRFLHSLPQWLHLGERNHNATDEPKEEKAEVAVEETRWQKGEVRCLHYGTIDDIGMRSLEGRSDHRPAIFAGAVYI